MMKRLPLMLMVFLCVSTAFSQCPTESVPFTTQSQIDQFVVDFPNCSELSQLVIDGQNITSLISFSNIISLTSGNLVIQNTSITTLAGLQSLSSVTNFTFINNDLVSTLSDFEDVLITEALVVSDNEALTSINALSLESLSKFEITDNPLLYACDVGYICEILNIDGPTPPPIGMGFEVANNAEGCNSFTEIAYDCQTICPPDFVQFTTQSQIDQFKLDYPNCTELPFGLSISGDDIVNLNGFSNLESVDGGLFIKDCASLKNLEGLNGLSLIAGGPYETLVEFSNNAQLENVDALENVTSDIGMELGFVLNPKLASIAGLKSINPELYTLYFYDNDLLVSMEGLENLEIVETFSIVNSPSLQSLNGLQNLKQITGGFNFYNNDQIMNFLPLGGVQLDCGLDIRDNEILDSIEGFVATVSDCSGSLFILNNPNLSVCSISYVCDLLNQIANDSSGVTSEIANNGADCQTVTMVEDLCGAEAPTNDNCENALAINLGVPFSLNFNGSTASQIIPTCEISSDYVAKDVWVTIDSGNATQISADLSSQLKFQFYSGNCDDLTPLEGACYQGSISIIDIEPNTEYIVQFWIDQVLARRQGPDYEVIFTAEKTLSLEASTLLDIVVIPNPTDGEFEIKNLSPAEIEKIELFSILGKKVLETTHPKVSMVAMESGMYLLKITDKQKNSLTKKIVKL